MDWTDLYEMVVTALEKRLLEAKTSLMTAGGIIFAKELRIPETTLAFKPSFYDIFMRE